MDDQTKIREAGNLAKYTLPSTDAKPPSATTTNPPSFSPAQIQEAEKKSHFWYTMQGKLWLLFFVLAIVFALIAGLFMYKQSMA